MEEPEINETIGGYQVRWPKLYLVANIRAVSIKGDGRVLGRLEIISNKSGHNVCLLPDTQFNFAAERTRTSFARSMSGKFDLNIEWQSIFDFLGHKIQELVRSGDNYIEVWPTEEISPPERLLGSIIYRGVQNIIFGEKGVAKSTLAYLFAICIGLPWYDNPFGLDVPSKSIKTLVLDWETEKPIFEYYLSRMVKGMELPYCPIFYRRCSLPLREDIEAIEKYIADTGAELLIIDSLGAAAGGEHGELKGSESALLFNSALRKLKCTSLIIAQTRHGETEGDKKKHIYGSVYFTYYARNIFELCRGQEDTGDNVHLALFHRDSNLGKKSSPMGFLMAFDDSDNTIKVEREPVSVAEFAEKISTGSRILDALKSGAMSSKDLKEILDVGRNTIDQAVKRLRVQRKIIDVGDKRWGLPVI